MAKRKPWEGPFKFENGRDGKCVKCDAKWQYQISFGGYSVAVCREHAVEGLTSKEGRRTIAEAEQEIHEIDDERWRSMNTHRLTWVPVGQRLPENGQNVIAYFPPQADCPDGGVGEAHYTGSAWSTQHGSWFDVTHWMPLPEPPEVK